MLSTKNSILSAMGYLKDKKGYSYFLNDILYADDFPESKWSRIKEICWICARLRKINVIDK